MATDTVVIHLPESLHHRLERLAELTQRPVENLIVQTLSSSLPPLPDDLHPATRDALVALEPLSDEELGHLARATFPEEDYAQLSALREKRRTAPLTAAEQTALDQLTQASDLLTLKKAYAAVLLKWRGHRLPTLAESDT